MPVHMKITQIGLHGIVILGDKTADFLLPRHNHRQRGSLYSSRRELRVIFAGQRAGYVEPYQPIRFRSALRRQIQVLIFSSVPQIGEALLDRLVGLGGDPQPFDRLAEARLCENPARHQFPFPSGVRRNNQGVHLLAVQQVFDHAVLLCRLGNHTELHLFWQHGQCFHAPGFILLAICLRIRQRHQMPQRPCHNVTVAGKESAAVLPASKHSCQFLSHRRFFRQHQCLSHFLDFLSIIQITAAPQNRIFSGNAFFRKRFHI